MGSHPVTPMTVGQQQESLSFLSHHLQQLISAHPETNN